MKPLARRLASLALALVVPCAGALAQEPSAAEIAAMERYYEALESLPWSDGPTTGELGAWATIDVPQGMRFLDADGARRYLELNENMTNGTEVGLIQSGDGTWFAVFEFDESGYVEDDERDELDPEEILAMLREGTEAGNEERRRRGWATMEIVGWMTPPHYDPATNNLEWATRATSSDGGSSANLNTRLLGRRGVMSVTLVAAPEDLEASLPAYRERLEGFSFKSGQRYSEYVSGDRIAEYGLTGLIAGGVGVAAVKSGMLGKLWKFAVAGVLVVVAAVKKLFGGKKDAPQGAETVPAADTPEPS